MTVIWLLKMSKRTKILSGNDSAYWLLQQTSMKNTRCAEVTESFCVFLTKQTWQVLTSNPWKQHGVRRQALHYLSKCLESFFKRTIHMVTRTPRNSSCSLASGTSDTISSSKLHIRKLRDVSVSSVFVMHFVVNQSIPHIVCRCDPIITFFFIRMQRQMRKRLSHV